MSVTRTEEKTKTNKEGREKRRGKAVDDVHVQENKLRCLNKMKHGDYEELLEDNDMWLGIKHTNKEWNCMDNDRGYRPQIDGIIKLMYARHLHRVNSK